ncbi:MAG: FHA domain-containing protein [Kofleriaceae bacterium]
MTNVLADLAARIVRVPGLVAEQITAPTPLADDDETDAVLCDQWGRLHPIRAASVIGRDAGNTLTVIQTSVSRRHAQLSYDMRRDSWTVTDLGSRNGTFLEGVRLPIGSPSPLGDRQLLVVGDVGFVFVLDRETLPAGRATESYRATVESHSAGAAELRLLPPTSEGAGIVGYGDVTLGLGSTQFALLRLLADRYLASVTEPDELRGFVRSIELITNLPWNTPHPEDNHVKQQVRRLRRALERLGLPDAIESRHGFGYRLCVRPVVVSER